MIPQEHTDSSKDSSQKSVQSLTTRQSVVRLLTFELTTLGTIRISHLYAWVAIGIMVGLISGILFVSNREGEIEGSEAAINCNLPRNREVCAFNELVPTGANADQRNAAVITALGNHVADITTAALQIKADNGDPNSQNKFDYKNHPSAALGWFEEACRLNLPLFTRAQGGRNMVCGVRDRLKREVDANNTIVEQVFGPGNPQVSLEDATAEFESRTANVSDAVAQTAPRPRRNGEQRRLAVQLLERLVPLARSNRPLAEQLLQNQNVRRSLALLGVSARIPVLNRINLADYRPETQQQNQRVTQRNEAYGLGALTHIVRIAREQADTPQERQRFDSTVISRDLVSNIFTNSGFIATNGVQNQAENLRAYSVVRTAQNVIQEEQRNTPLHTVMNAVRFGADVALAAQGTRGGRVHGGWGNNSEQLAETMTNFAQDHRARLTMTQNLRTNLREIRRVIGNPRRIPLVRLQRQTSEGVSNTYETGAVALAQEIVITQNIRALLENWREAAITAIEIRGFQEGDTSTYIQQAQTYIARGDAAVLRMEGNPGQATLAFAEFHSAVGVALAFTPMQNQINSVLDEGGYRSTLIPEYINNPLALELSGSLKTTLAQVSNQMQGPVPEGDIALSHHQLHDLGQPIINRDAANLATVPQGTAAIAPRGQVYVRTTEEQAEKIQQGSPLYVRTYTLPSGESVVFAGNEAGAITAFGTEAAAELISPLNNLGIPHEVFGFEAGFANTGASAAVVQTTLTGSTLDFSNVQTNLNTHAANLNGLGNDALLITGSTFIIGDGIDLSTFGPQHFGMTFSFDLTAGGIGPLMQNIGIPAAVLNTPGSTFGIPGFDLTLQLETTLPPANHF